MKTPLGSDRKPTEVRPCPQGVVDCQASGGTVRTYQVVVIGAGSAGLVAATTAKRLGARTALIEHNKVGGECLHSGCVPSKTLIHSAKLFYEMTRAERYGLPPVAPDLDFARVMEHVQQVVHGIYQHENPAVFREMGIDVYEGGAGFTSPQEIQVNGQALGFERAIICTGSSPLILPIEGLDKINYLTNENVWALRELPPSLLVIGAGPISVEMGQSFSRFGSNVTLVEIMDRVVPNEDEEISRELQRILEGEGVTCLTSSKVVKVEPAGKEIAVTVEGAKSQQLVRAAAIMVSVGRSPNLNGLQLENAQVQYSRRGIEVNPYLQTSAPSIYAGGDVVGPFRFTHTASYQADVAVKNALGNPRTQQDLRVLPWVTFSDPECARVGMTEAEARKEHGQVTVLRIGADSVDRPRTEGKTEGFLKIILDTSDRILGGHALAAHAGEYIHEIALAMQERLNIQALANLIHAYPTYSELVKKAAVRYLRTK